MLAGTVKTPDIYNFWERYNYSFETDNVFETYDGTAILTNRVDIR